MLTERSMLIIGMYIKTIILYAVPVSLGTVLIWSGLGEGFITYIALLCLVIIITKMCGKESILQTKALLVEKGLE